MGLALALALAGAAPASAAGATPPPAGPDAPAAPEAAPGAKPAPPPLAAVATASSARADAPAGAAADGDPATAWHSVGGGAQWLALDLGEVRTLAGVLVQWAGDDFASEYRIEVSADGGSWDTVRTVAAGNGGIDVLYLGHVSARFLRLACTRGASADGYGVVRLEAVSAERWPGPNDAAAEVAAAAPPGAFPRYLSGEQTTWTAVGVSGGSSTALVDADGMVEPAMRSFSLEPFLGVDDTLLSWNSVESDQTLVEGDLPIPQVRWQHGDVTFVQTVFAAGSPGHAVLYLLYRVENRGATPHHTVLSVAVRPFQVNPPWQSLNGAGGFSPIHHLERDGRVVRVNDDVAVVALTPPDAFGAVASDAAALAEWLAAGALPAAAEASDPLGFAAGALRWDRTVAPGEAAIVALAVPFGDPARFLAALPDPEAALAAAGTELDATVRRWRLALTGPSLQLPPAAGRIGAAMRSAIAQILVARDGPALQPGTRTYARTWIRDGVLMESALLQMGRPGPARAFVEWYAPFQRPDGTVPCCVDARGPDSAVEHDSHGELIYGIVTLYRYERDLALLRQLWPHVEAAVDAIDRLRGERRTAAYETPEKRAFYGLLPESISHEGYWKHAVHSYWDDTWALRGLDDAVLAARALGEQAAERHFTAVRDSFRADLRASLEATMRAHGLDTIPASADLADFDPSATSMALALGLRPLFPADALRRTYDRYVEDFRRRRAGDIVLDAYSPYELRNVEALVRLGRRNDALFVLSEILSDQRPPGWNGWGEVVWRDPRTPRFIGDMPHAWVGATFVRAARTMLAYEREDGALVLAAGVPRGWAESPTGLAVGNLPTYYGPVSYRMTPIAPGQLEVSVGAGTEIPPGGIVVTPPAPLVAATVDGRPAAEWTPAGVTLRALPAEVRLVYGETRGDVASR